MPAWRSRRATGTTTPIATTGRERKARDLKRYRLAVLAPHPVQYHVPFYRALADHPEIDLRVLYCSDLGISEKVDPEFGIPLNWGLPLLEGYPYQFLPNLSPFREAGRFWSLVNPGILSSLFKRRYDAVIIPGYAYASFLLGFLSAWLSRTPVFLRGETVLRPEPRWSPKSWGKKLFLRILLRGTHACLSIGTPSRLFYRAHQVPENRIFFSPYSVDNEFFHQENQRWKERRRELKRSMGMEPNTPVILFCGKLVERKRPLDLLAAFLSLRYPAILLLVGEGSQRTVLEQRAAGHPHVFMPGFINQRELPKYYALADIFVLPSEREVAPLVVHEAMVCGLPVLLSDAVPSAVDFVRSGENGFVFPLGNIAALSLHLETLMQDEGLRRRMGERSAALIQSWTPAAGVAGVLQALGSLR